MFRTRTAAADEAPFSKLDRDANTNERLVRKGFWPKVTRVAGRLPFAEDLLAAYYCAFDRQTPMQVRMILLGALAYFVLPFDGIPDVLPILGFSDDAAILAAAIKVTLDSIKPEHRDAAKRKLSE